MSARGKIDYAKRAAKLIASEMDPGDTFSLITFNDEATTVIGATSVSDPRSIHRQIDRIYEGGGTNLYEGLSRGAREVERTLHDEAVGRVVILSDGHANVGVTDTDSLSRYAATIAGKGVSVSTIGLGLDYNEDLLANMADLSGGTYDFVDDPRDLESVFADELDRTASVIAADTQVTIQLPDGVTPIEVIGWDAKPNGNGWTVPIGNVYSGDTRKVIARVRVDSAFSQGRAHVEPDIEVASVRLDYQDVVDDITASAHASAAAQLRERAIEANRAYGSWFLNESAHAYKNGEVQKSRDLLQAGSSILKSASSQLSAPELANEADDLDQQELLYDSYAPASDEGKRAIKSGKERFRGRAR